MSARTSGVRRRGRGRTSITIVDAAQRILNEIAPATVRAVCYRLFVEALIPNMSKASTNKVSRLLVGAREQGIIDWNDIVDETREVEQLPSWNDPESLIRAAVSQYRKDYWGHQPNRIEVWSEKGTVRGTLKPVLDEFGVAFRVMHGYGSATAIKSIAEASAESDRPFIALYVGDWDPSGLHMSEVDLPKRLDAYGAGEELGVARIALVAPDVVEGGLPSFAAETKRGDPRYPVVHLPLRQDLLGAGRTLSGRPPQARGGRHHFPAGRAAMATHGRGREGRARVHDRGARPVGQIDGCLKLHMNTRTIPGLLDLGLLSAPPNVCRNCYAVFRASRPRTPFAWCWHSRTAARQRKDGSWAALTNVTDLELKALLSGEAAT